MASSAPGSSASKNSLRTGKSSDKDRPAEGKSLPRSEGKPLYDRDMAARSKGEPSGHDVKLKHSKESKVKSSKEAAKGSLIDYPQTKKAAEAIIGANSKSSEKVEKLGKKETPLVDFFSPPRKRRDISSSPSPARERENENRTEPAQKASKQQTLSDSAKHLEVMGGIYQDRLTLQDYQGGMRDMSSEDLAANMKRLQDFRNMSQLFDDFSARVGQENSSRRDREVSPPRRKTPPRREETPPPRRSEPPPRTATSRSKEEEVLPPVPIPQIVFPKEYQDNLMAMFLMNAAQNWGKPNPPNPPVNPFFATTPKKVIKVEGDEAEEGEINTEDEEEESPLAAWSGLHQEFKNDVVVISELAKQFWASVIGTDAKGRNELGFKRPFKRATKLKFFTEGDDLICFRPPQRNPQLPNLHGFRLKEEEDILSMQKGSGAAAAAACAAVDALRALVADMRAYAHDFAEGAFEDPVQEAEYICNSVIRMIEEGAIANIIQAIRFIGGTFTFCSFKRHLLALRVVTAEDAKKVLAESPPDSAWLFGAEIKDSIQKIRDGALISRAFVARGSARGGYRNQGNRGGYGHKGNRGGYVHKDQRFRGRGARNKKSRRPYGGPYDGSYGSYGNYSNYGPKDKEKTKKDKDE